jgi:hypothetical protein
MIWAAEYGEIENGLEVCHECDTPLCCEIQHLYLGTHARNMGDAVLRDRFPDRQGENHPGVLLTGIQVSHIKYFLQRSWSATELAKRYPVSREAIYQIKAGRNWRDVQPFQPVDDEALPVPPPPKPQLTYAELSALLKE